MAGCLKAPCGGRTYAKRLEGSLEKQRTRPFRVAQKAILCHPTWGSTQLAQQWTEPYLVADAFSGEVMLQITIDGGRTVLAAQSGIIDVITQAMAQYWDDPSEVGLAALPKFSGGEGSTVFWSTGCALLKHGQNKEEAAQYIRALTYDPQIWRDSIVGTETGRPGELPPYQSIHAGWQANRPDWMPDFVGLARDQMDRARAIQTHLFGLQQFFIGQPIWETYLKGEESNPRVALQKVAAAVQAEVQRG